MKLSRRITLALLRLIGIIVLTVAAVAGGPLMTQAFFNSVLTTQGEMITGDWTAPVVENISLDKEFVKAGDTLIVQADVSDPHSGVKAVSADFSYNAEYTDRPTPTSVLMTRISGDKYNGHYSVAYVVPSFWPEGFVYITVAARDFEDNYEGNRSLAQTVVVDNTSPTSEIPFGSLESSYNSHTFPISYTAGDGADGSGVREVELYYSYNSGDWIRFGEVSVPDDSGEGTFNFTSPQGDGTYSFKTIAIDNAGNTEEKNLADASTQVDTEAPYTNLSLGEFGDDDQGQNRFAFNEQMVNGNFEDDSDPSGGWVLGGDGDHRIVNNLDLASEAEVKRGKNSALVGWFDTTSSGEGEDYIYQVVPVADESATLSFWYRIISNDVVEYDWFEAKIIDDANPDSQEVILQTGSDSGPSYDSGWQEITYSLANWLDQTIRVWFGVINHDPDPLPPENTFALVDDVRITEGKNYLTANKKVDFQSDDVGSGTGKTYYRINEGDWKTADSGSIVLANEGVSSGEAKIDYYSVDVAGNEEEVKSLLVQVDQKENYFNIVLNQISPRPSGDNDSGDADLPLDGEWVELWNNGEADVNVDGWVLREGSGAYLVISANNADNDGDLSDEGETIVPPGGWLRVYRNGDSDFNLNDDGDKVELLTDYLGSGGILIDSYTYAAVTTDDKTWRRIPDGTGTWADPREEESLTVEVKALGGDKIILSIANLPDDYSEDKLIEYELVYSSAGVEQGIAGTILPDKVKNCRADLELYLGTCSGGDCSPHSVDDRKVKVTLRQGEDIIVDQEEFSI